MPKILHRLTHLLKTQFSRWFIVGICLSWLWACGSGTLTVNSPETAAQMLQDQLLPQIEVEEAFVPDQIAARYAIDSLTEPLPNLEDFPLYGAKPNSSPNALYLEIFSSSEKANAEKQNERWLIEVAEAFNQQQIQTDAGQTIQVGIRKVPSGTAARLLAAGKAQPAGYSPSNDLWISMLQSEGVNEVPIQARLVPNTAGFVISDAAFQKLGQGEATTFEDVLSAILAGDLTVGYPNPYTSSTSLNLLYTLFWRGAGHHEDGQPLMAADMESPQVNSLFTAFQDQVLLTTVTTLDLQEIFIRDQQVLQAFPLEFQNYQTLKQLPGFEQVHFVPFGLPHNNPLVGFEWNSAEVQSALKRFGEFATSDAMQQLAQQQGFTVTDYLKQTGLPPAPEGSVLTAAQSYWKLRKDGGRTVYMMVVVDTSGSMEGEPLQAVQTGLKVASQEINAGNYVGMITFGDRTTYRLPLAPFDDDQHRRFLAAVDELRADGSTAMYDATMVALSDLMQRKQADPNGQFYLMLLSDGEANVGLDFQAVKEVLRYSGIRVYPIAYGNVNEAELKEIASLRESTVQSGTPDNVQDLLKGIFQTNL